MGSSETASLRQAICRHISLERIEAYSDLLLAENKTINLVSRETTPEDLLRLTAESLFPLDYIQPGCSRYLDIGSGGGFPAIPLLIAGEGQNTAVLLERTLKKVDALNRMIRRMDLQAEAVQGDFPTNAPEQTFDLITLRYVKLSPKILESALDLLAQEGRFIYYGVPEFDYAGHKPAVNFLAPYQGNPAKQVTIFQKP